MSMFPEGQGKPKAVAKDGGAAPLPLIVALLVNAKAAVKKLRKCGKGKSPQYAAHLRAAAALNLTVPARSSSASSSATGCTVGP